ncbi:MAG: hypothetical protein QNI94_18195 [Kiloniellales bacterium]|nr:hypothetical protein [Kiloniellales bacterium]
MIRSNLGPLRPTAFLTAALLALASCSSSPPPKEIESYDQAVSRWMEQTEANLVNAWGIPQKSHSMETGGRVIEYVRVKSGKTLCTTRFTIDGYGLIKKTWFRGSDCQVPSAS